MTSITLEVTGAKAKATVNGLLTSGMTGIQVTIKYDNSWKGLIKNLVCKSEPEFCSIVNTTRTITNVETTATIAHEMMKANWILYLGIEGHSSDGELIIPTTWAKCGKILPGAAADADPLADPTSPIWVQLQNQINDLKENGTGNGSTDSSQNVKLPLNEDGTPDYGTAGYYAVSDGAGGIKWVEAAPDTGGDSGGDAETTTHGVVWDLVNVTSSNNVVSVLNGAVLSAVLTPAEGYRLGNVTVTMGGEALTGVWNADTATVTIPSVTGDVIISCAGVVINTEPADTTPVIAEYDVTGPGSETPAVGFCVTKEYQYQYDKEKLKASPYYDAENNYMKQAGVMGGIAVLTSSENYVANGGSAMDAYQNGFGMRFYMDGVLTESKSLYTSFRDHTEYKMGLGRYITEYIDGDIFGVRCSLSTADLDNSYAYWHINNGGSNCVFPIGVRAGDIVFAGKNTPYYGMANIDGTMISAALTMDADYAQDYTVATTSMLGNDPVGDTENSINISTEFAEVINTAKKEWMTEYGGDYRKIPLIVSTDQHGRLTSGVFRLLSNILNMHDVSKICNLGDTVTDKWYDADKDKPLLECAELEKWMECIAGIPFSKRLDVIGNHDAWYGNGTTSGNAIGTAYPSNLSHLDQYFRNIYARRTNNNGWFAIKDDYFNVKYVVVTGLEWSGSAAYRISTAQMDWLIGELSANDGYDVVIVSHVPLKWDDTAMVQPTGDTNASGGGRLSDLNTDAFFAARKAKGSGTITDSEGVEHTYDFSGCETDVLCSLHGHLHCDAYLYLENQLLVNCFDWFPYETFFMVLIDRVNRQLNIWKIDNTPQYVNYRIPLDKPVA